MSPESETVLVRLTAIQGGIDLLNERVKGVREDINSLKLDQVNITARVTALETQNSIRMGERHGLATGGRILWTGLGMIMGSGGFLGLLRIFGGL